MAIVQQPGVTRTSGTPNSSQSSSTLNLARVDVGAFSPDLRVPGASANQRDMHVLISRLSTGASPA